MNLTDFVRQSNAIEGILREPLAEEIEAHRKFLAESPSVASLTDLALALTKGYGRLRVSPGMDVRVGNHRPAPGGPDIAIHLDAILQAAQRRNPWVTHVQYETLHPFMDGNGRTGRALWLWQIGGDLATLPPLGFLHAFYYQTLNNVQASSTGAPSDG